jgi:hypothetical protein
VYAARVRVMCNKINIFPALLLPRFAIVTNHSQGSYQSGGAKAQANGGAQSLSWFRATPLSPTQARSNQYLLYVYTAISLEVITMSQGFGRPPKHNAISTAPEKECTKFTPLTSVLHQNHIYFRLEMTMIVDEVRVSDNYYHEDRYIRDPLNQRRESEMIQFRKLQI